MNGEPLTKTLSRHTPGPWEWWTSNSWRRLKRDDRGITQNVLEPYVCRDGHPDLTISEADMALIAAAPDLLASLIDVLETFSLGPLGAAAKYGPDVDLRAIEEAAVSNARAAIDKARPSHERTQKITVCASCLRASCWQGEFYCDDYKSAGTVEKTIDDGTQS